MLIECLQTDPGQNSIKVMKKSEKDVMKQERLIFRKKNPTIRLQSIILIASIMLVAGWTHQEDHYGFNPSGYQQAMDH